jgi:hypothetical protein
MATFQSKFKNHQIFIKAPRKILVNNEIILDPGVKVEFRNNKLKIDDPEIIAKLKAMSTYGIEFFEVDSSELSSLREKSRTEMVDGARSESTIPQSESEDIIPLVNEGLKAKRGRPKGG